VSRATIHEEMEGYYTGEANSALLIGGFGAFGVGAGSVLVTRDSDFARGLGWPLLTLGALEVAGGIAYSVAVAGEVDHYETSLARDPAQFQREERAHIHGTNSRFIVYRLGELGIFLAGAAMATYGFAADRDAWKGAGIGVAALALPLIVIDTFNQARATRYEQDLGRFQPTLALGGGPHGAWGMSLSSTF